MAIQLATNTMLAIENAIAADQGAVFRTFLGQVIPHMSDAYRGADEGFRSHLGASLIGRECAREIWYGFRWAKKPSFSGRMIRLFNRGHLEEARFIAMLLTIGCRIYQQDENGKQYRISDVGGHFGGSGDGVAIGVLDVPAGQPCLTEFKTHGEKSFLKLQKEGVRVAKFEHFVQMQVYMRKMGIFYALYCAVNKNNDDIHMEIIMLDTYIADQFIDRAKQIIMLRVAPEKINNASPGLFACRYCEMRDICMHNAPMEKNCRTCYKALVQPDGTWHCTSAQRLYSKPDPVLSKEDQLAGCEHHVQI